MSDDDVVPRGISFLSLVEPSGRLALPEFTATYGPAFLVLVTSKPDQPRTRGPTAPHSLSDEATGEARVLVSPLVKKPTNQSAVLRVGRGDSCDVVLADVTISKLHAFLQPDGDTFSVLDAGSRNGTFVGEDRVAARGIGKPTKLRPSAKVRFGSVTMTYVDAGQLYAAARQRLTTPQQR